MELDEGADSCKEQAGVFQAPGNLLACCQTQWQVGDWQSLAKLNIETIENTSERASIAVLAAVGHAQLGHHGEARKLISAAIRWGFNKNAAIKFLIAGVHNNLGRASTVANLQPQASDHFRRSLNIVAADSATAALLKVRSSIQSRQDYDQVMNDSEKSISDDIYGDDAPIGKGQEAAEDINVSFGKSIEDNFTDNAVTVLISGNQAEQQLILDAISENVQKITKENNSLHYELLIANIGASEYKFVHVGNDYIPGKIVATKNFYEGQFLEFVSKFYRTNSYIIDCGANIGNHTIYFAKVLGAKTIAIEPEPHNFACLKLNVYLNKLVAKVQIFNCALGSDVGEIKLAMSIGNNFGSFTGVNTIGEYESMVVTAPVAKLDDIIDIAKPEGKVSIIKIDVEGMELDVLRGAAKVISRDYPAIAVECSSHDALLLIEGELQQYGYYPIEVMNATPTFIFINKSNEFHSRKFVEYLRNIALNKAAFGNC